MAGRELRGKAAALARVREEWAAKPWWRKYWKPIVTAITLPLAGYGWFRHEQTIEHKEILQKEKDKYGNLWEYRDRIPQKMVSEEDHYKPFLLQLKKHGGKYVVNVYLGPPIGHGTHFHLVEVPYDLKEKAKQGFSVWNEYFDFNYVTSRKDADLSVYFESQVFPASGDVAHAITPRVWALKGWSESTVDKEYLGRSIIFGTQTLAQRTSTPYYMTNSVAHEFGHHIGLVHAEALFYAEAAKDNDPALLTNEASFEAARKIIDKIIKQYDLDKFSIMVGTSNPNASRYELGEFDRKAFSIIEERARLDPSEHHQPPTKTSGQIEDGGFKWRERDQQQKDAIPKSSTGIPGR